MHNIFS